MSEKEALKALGELVGCTDVETAHADADGVLLSFLRDNGHRTLADKFNEVCKEVGFLYA